MFFPNKKPLPEKLEQHAQKQVEKQQKLVGRIVPHKGHTLFEINCTTGEITEAVFETVAVDYAANQKGVMRKKIITKENCLYVSCLNKTNAKKKFIDYLFKIAKTPN